MGSSRLPRSRPPPRPAPRRTSGRRKGLPRLLGGRGSERPPPPAATLPRAPPRGRSSVPPRHLGPRRFPRRGAGRGRREAAGACHGPGCGGAAKRPQPRLLSAGGWSAAAFPPPLIPPASPSLLTPSLRSRSRVRSAAAAPPSRAGRGWRGGTPLGRLRPGWEGPGRH